jgi:hypothetical protein
VAVQICNKDLERRIRGALLNIDVAIAHLKSVAFALASANNPSLSSSVESAITWLVDAKNELQPLLDDVHKNVLVSIDTSVAIEVARKTRITVEDAVETLISKCIENYLSDRG